MAEGHREAAHSVLDGGEHNATLGASGIARLTGSGPLENGHAVLRLIVFPGLCVRRDQKPVISLTSSDDWRAVPYGWHGPRRRL